MNVFNVGNTPLYITQKTQDPKTYARYEKGINMLYITQKTQDPKTLIIC